MKKIIKAAVLYRNNHPLELMSIEPKYQLERGQVLVKLINSGICGAQINEIKGISGFDKYLPHLMGHEGYAKVVKIGPDVKVVKTGDKVILHWRKSFGINAKPAKFKSNTQIINSGNVTTFSNYSIVSENRCTKVNLNKNLKKIAPLFGCALTTSYGIVYKEAKIKKNDKILLIGCGGLGLSIAGFIDTLQNKNLIIIENKLNKHKKKFIDNLSFAPKIINSINEIKNNKDYTFDKIIDTSGNVEILRDAFTLLNKSSDLILVGQPKINSKLILKNPLSFFQGKKIYASDGGSIHPGKHLKQVIKLVSRHAKLFNSIVSKTISLKDINKGISLMLNKKAARIIVSFNN